MGLQISNRAIAQAAAIFAGLAIEDLAGKIEEEMKKEPGTWDLVFWYHTMDRGSDAYFTVTLGPDLRVLKVGEVGKTRQGTFR